VRQKCMPNAQIYIFCNAIFQRSATTAGCDAVFAADWGWDWDGGAQGDRPTKAGIHPQTSRAKRPEKEGKIHKLRAFQETEAGQWDKLPRVGK
jgi:hypothetical protein